VAFYDKLRGVTEQLWQGAGRSTETPQQGMRYQGRQHCPQRGFAGFVGHFQRENKGKE